MKWISLKEQSPQEDGLYYVCHVGAYRYTTLAIYDKKYNIFSLYDPSEWTKWPLLISHWYPLPVEMPPKEFNEMD